MDTWIDRDRYMKKDGLIDREIDTLTCLYIHLQKAPKADVRKSFQGLGPHVSAHRPEDG